MSVAVAGPLAADLYDNRSLVLAFACVALRPLVDLALLGPQTRLRVRLAFKYLSVIDAVCQAGATALSVIMAATGLDWWSLLLPQVLFTAVRAAAYAKAAGPAPNGPRWVPREMRPIATAYAWSGLGQYVHGALLMLPPLVIVAVNVVLVAAQISLLALSDTMLIVGVVVGFTVMVKLVVVVATTTV